MADIPEESTIQSQQVHDCSSYPLSFPSQPPDIKNWFSSYEYESPEAPELAADHCGNSGSETQDPLEVGVPDHSLLEHTTHDADAALNGHHCEDKYEHQVSSIRGLIPTGRSIAKPVAKRKQSLRNLFGADFFDDFGEPTETERSQVLLSVQRNEANPLSECHEMGLSDTKGRQEGADEHGKLPADCDSFSLADTQDGSQVHEEIVHNRLPVDGDGVSLSHTKKSSPEDGNEHSKLLANCTSTSIPYTERRSQADAIQHSKLPVNCNDIIVPVTEENSPSYGTCRGKPILDDNEHEETAVADGFVVIKRKEKPERAPKINKIPKPPMRREEAAMQENGGIMQQKALVQGRTRSPLADRTNVSEVAAAPTPDLRGKWKCPRKGKPSVGPPLKQLRLEKWVRRVD